VSATIDRPDPDLARVRKLFRPASDFEQAAWEAFHRFAVEHACCPRSWKDRLLRRPAPVREAVLVVENTLTGHVATVRCNCGASRDITDPRL
jgi:hypothetical protein